MATLAERYPGRACSAWTSSTITWNWRARHAAWAPRVSFEHQSIFGLPGAPDATYDLTVCRHVIQSIPHADVLAN